MNEKIEQNASKSGKTRAGKHMLGIDPALVGKQH